MPSRPFWRPFWADSEGVSASPDPIVLPGGSTTVVLVHGYSGSPAELGLLADSLQREGYGVECPLLVGHGTCLEDLMPVEPDQWLKQIDAVVDRLQHQGQSVVVGGLSLGAILALQVARRRPCIQGVITYSPPIISGDPRALIAPLLSRFLTSVPRPADDFVDPTTAERIWTYNRWPSRCSVKVLELIADTRHHLAEVTQPLLVMASRLDRVITARGVNHLRQRVSSPSVKLQWLENSGHLITTDAEWRTVADVTADFIRRLSTTPAAINTKG
jgi:carboxylesterase